MDMNVALADAQSALPEWTAGERRERERLATTPACLLTPPTELTTQLRLLSLQRPPLVFTFHAKGSDVALQQVQSRDPRMSGLVIVVSQSDLAEVESQLAGVDKNKLRILVVDENQDKGAAFQQVERWMSAQGLA